MHKLVILIEPLDDWGRFEAVWPEFLRQAEAMPGLRREVTAHVEAVLFGMNPVGLVHELHFDSLDAAQAAMATQPGRAAGKLLQEMTGGRMTLFFAHHLEDDLEHIRSFQATKEQSD